MVVDIIIANNSQSIIDFDSKFRYFFFLDDGKMPSLSISLAIDGASRIPIYIIRIDWRHNCSLIVRH